MKIKMAVVIVISVLVSGCAVYAPTPYGYAVAPVVPMPVFGFGGWGRGGFRR